jgi:hypothetical protein
MQEHYPIATGTGVPNACSVGIYDDVLQLTNDWPTLYDGHLDKFQKCVIAEL